MIDILKMEFVTKEETEHEGNDVDDIQKMLANIRENSPIPEAVKLYYFSGFRHLEHHEGTFCNTKPEDKGNRRAEGLTKQIAGEAQETSGLYEKQAQFDML